MSRFDGAVAMLDRRLPPTKRPALAVGIGAVVTTVFLIRVIAEPWETKFPLFFPDSSSYLQVARDGPFSISFWFGDRPFVAPLLYWAAGRNLQLIVLAQSLIYVAAFWWACLVAIRVLRSAPARVVAVVLVTGVAVQPRFALWNTEILSESLTISLGTVMAANWWWWSAEPSSTSRLRWAFAATVVWTLTRDSNLLVAFAIVVPVGVFVVWKWAWPNGAVRRTMRRGLVAIGVATIAVVLAQGASDRTRYPVLNIIGQRVLVDEELTEFYADAGMPVDALVLGRAGKSSFDDDSAMLQSPDLSHLRAWAASDGQTLQLWSFVRFAPRFIGDVWDDLPAELSTDHRSYDLADVSDRLPDGPPWVFGGPRDHDELLLWSGLAALGIIAACVPRSRRPQGVVLGVLLASCALDLYLSWLGDSVEVQRHMVGAVERTTLVLMMCACIVLDEIVRPTARRLPDPSSVAATTTPIDPTTTDVADDVSESTS